MKNKTLSLFKKLARAIKDGLEGAGLFLSF